MITKEQYSKQGKASKRKGKLGENITTDEFEKYKFCEVWQQPASGAKSNKKYKLDLYIRMKFEDDLKYEFKDENKFHKKIAVFRWWEKLLKEIMPNHIPMMTLKEDYSDILVVLKLKDLLSIFEDLYRRLDQIKQENTIINYDNKRVVKEIKYKAAEIEKLVSKL